MNLSLLGKKAIVCGSTDGIGKSSAMLMAKRGAEIILVSRNKDKLEMTISELSWENGQNHSFISADFNNSDELEEKINNHFNNAIFKADILINNSGGPHGGDILDAEEDEFRIAFERLLICNHILAKAVVPGMKTLGRGRIINIISMSIQQVIPGLGVSNTIRGSVAQWAKTFALELGRYDITVNNILPGYTSTNRLKDLAETKSRAQGCSPIDIQESWAVSTSLRRLGKPEEIASAVAFLASDSADYINGFNLSVDGGRIGV